MSGLTEILMREIATAPEVVQQQVFDYLMYLKARRAPDAEGQENLLPLAQTAWAADGDTFAEDEAWRNLDAEIPPAHNLPISTHE